MCVAAYIYGILRSGCLHSVLVNNWGNQMPYLLTYTIKDHNASMLIFSSIVAKYLFQQVCEIEIRPLGCPKQWNATNLYSRGWVGFYI